MSTKQAQTNNGCLEPTNVKVNDEEIEMVNIVKYIGSLIEAGEMGQKRSNGCWQ